MATQLHLILTPGIHGAMFLEDSYDATPSSTLSVLNLVDDLPQRKVAVFGDLKELAHQEQDGHSKVGRRAAEVVANLVTVGQLGRVIAQEALDSGMSPDSVYPAGDIQAAVDKLKSVIEREDIVLVCGSGRLGLKAIVDELIDTQTSICEV
jgi:UDP-N-acetylmuramoyl-tripeptide--D-alanyl-D-alanine ligase